MLDTALQRLQAKGHHCAQIPLPSYQGIRPLQKCCADMHDPSRVLQPGQFACLWVAMIFYKSFRLVRDALQSLPLLLVNFL